ncbi:hypothetical protein [Aliiglaciecola lipolytica]|uniref:hypothetical protein n=1 Tax=Aliiglaciecola lipolytica TaxID=477689 RepID=UPI001C0A41FD|nr:hypothetical protein [Aliiglaciecola lipolytica]MBU2877593.1 hypothetical protein [Aliiglaciecola lipolytica]
MNPVEQLNDSIENVLAYFEHDPEALSKCLASEIEHLVDLKYHMVELEKAVRLAEDNAVVLSYPH